MEFAEGTRWVLIAYGEFQLDSKNVDLEIIDVEMLDRLISELPLSCVVVDGEGLIKVYNEGCEKILGFSKAEVMDKRWDKVIYFEPKVRNLLMMSFRNRKVALFDNVNMVRKNMEMVPCEVKTVPIVTSGTVHFVIAYFNDVSERERMKENVTRLAKFDFLEKISIAIAHEIRNPLMVLSGVLNVLKVKQCGDCLNAKMLQGAIQEIDTISKIIDNFLYFAKAKKLNYEPTQVADVIVDLKNKFTLLLMGKKVNLSCEIEDDLPIVELDRNSIRQILYNLMLNSINAINYTGDICIKAKMFDRKDLSGCYVISKYFDRPIKFNKSFLDYIRPENYIFLSVTDSGGKLGTKNLGSVFHPFTSLREKGIGLGLSVIRALVDEHNGGIVVRCVVDKFTKIGIFLPCNRSI